MKKGFREYYSAELGQRVYLHKEQGFIETNDRIVYTKQEVERYKKALRKVNKPIHLVKQVFGGEIVRVE